MIVPFPAGGPTDTLGRILAEGMGASLGQTIIIENVTGAGSTIGVSHAAQAAPDGYTLSLGNWTSHMGSGALYSIQYDLLKDFEPISAGAAQQAIPDPCELHGRASHQDAQQAGGPCGPPRSGSR
jgi:tripartite-type tricarboxylate transporter receptor subunit TctC